MATRKEKNKGTSTLLPKYIKSMIRAIAKSVKARRA
jgi:hypothetical protein